METFKEKWRAIFARVRALPIELQEVWLEDVVDACENRLKVLEKHGRH